LHGWYRAVEWIADNPEEAADIVTDGSTHEAYVASDDKELLVELLKSYKYHGTHNEANSTTQPYEDALYFAEELKKTGYLPAELDAQQFADKLWAEVDWQKSGTAGKSDGWLANSKRLNLASPPKHSSFGGRLA
jgi:NitT/TauT family transport system substrate-binding protein